MEGFSVFLIVFYKLSALTAGACPRMAASPKGALTVGWIKNAEMQNTPKKLSTMQKRKRSNAEIHFKPKQPLQRNPLGHSFSPFITTIQGILSARHSVGSSCVGLKYFSAFCLVFMSFLYFLHFSIHPPTKATFGEAATRGHAPAKSAENAEN